ncbi:beta-aspartyl-peptidase [Neisseria sp. Ec49-e6-T10]|uniref:beta-aspartyl-peptidase n=1 Tax=Neisseria sp. Ec49-e6-T10 TaxID=3140744 RepID=UPI003EB8177F
MNTIKSLSLQFTLLKNAAIYAPEALGEKDILICNDKIVAIEQNIDASTIPNCTSLDLTGLTVCPGFIDQHIHLIGGGGEAGPHTRTPEVKLSSLIEAGITTAVGLLGTDGMTRHPETLLAKVKALNFEGITAYMLTGAYTVPTPTITGQIDKDIALIDGIIGVKTAISDHRSSAPTIAELCRLSTQARVGGLLGAKAGISVFHLGSSKKTLEPIDHILANCDVPINKLLPTHVNRNQVLFDAAIAFALKGGYIDLTSGINPELGARNAVKPSKAVMQALKAGVALDHITISSDGNGSQPVFNAQGQLTGITVAGFASLLAELKDMVQKEGLCLSEALQPFTSSVAQFLQIDKGHLKPNADADILVLNKDMNIEYVFAKGKKMVHNGKACIKGTFEE